MIVAARLKAELDRALMIGWQVERMSREGKRMKLLAKYLETPFEPTPEMGAADLRAMIARIAQKREGGDGAR